MGFFTWIILGAIVGAIAKAILPGRIGGGLLPQLLLGIAGGVVGGWLGSALFDIQYKSFFSPWTWLLSIGGAVIVLAVWGVLNKNKKR
jgi:uncharacterized membrane protein YeaQ/YmgE (transglycosylase-associated protein family)